MRFDGVFFDSGGTLFGAAGGDDPTPSEVWDGRIERVGAMMGEYGLSPNAATLRAAVLKCEDQCQRRLRDSYNFFRLMAAVLDELGLNLGPEVAACLADAYAGPRYASWLFAGTKHVLGELSRAGLRLGLIANTAWPGFCLDRALTGVGLLDLLPTRLYSGDLGIAKPDVRIFRLAERLSGVSGRRMLYVGNDLEADIKGAARAGWSTAMRRPTSPRGRETPAPGRTASSASGGLADFEFDHTQQLLEFVL